MVFSWTAISRRNSGRFACAACSSSSAWRVSAREPAPYFSNDCVNCRESCRAVMVLLVPITLAIRGTLRPAFLLLPVVIALMFGFVLGCALIVSALHAYFRDVAPVLAAALLPWFFLTPILWNAATLPPSAQRHHRLLEVLHWGNPITPPIYAVRDALWSGHLPRLADVALLAGRRVRIRPPRSPRTPRRREGGDVSWYRSRALKARNHAEGADEVTDLLATLASLAVDN